MRAGSRSGLSRNRRTANREASAACRPWPSPSAISTRVRPLPASSACHPSPQAVSPRLGRQTTPTSSHAASADAAATGGRGHSRDSSTVPWGTVVNTSNVLDSRAIAPSPVPGVPAVE